MKLIVPGILHDHIDGSAALVDIIEELYALAGQSFPFGSKEEWRSFFNDPYADIVAKFRTVTGVLQSAEALELAAFAFGARRAEEGYEYVEGRFAPQYHVFGGLTLRQAVEAVRTGLASAEIVHGIRLMPIVCIGREATPETGVEIARLALDYGGQVALDLACDEAGHPPEKHLPAYRLTRGTAVFRTCHAGEWVRRDPADTPESYRRRLLQNVRTAVRELQVDGLGHAIPLIDDPELTREVADRGIRVESCPASYVQSGLIKDVRELGLGALLDAGVVLTVNPDDDLFLPAMPIALEICDGAYGFSPEQARRLADNVWRGAFAADIRRG